LPLHALPKAKVGKNLRKVNDEALLSAKKCKSSLQNNTCGTPTT